MLTIIKAGVVLILLTPLVMGSFGINISEYPKAIYFRSLTEIVFILYLVLIAFKLKYIFKISPLLIAVFIFIAVLTLASFTGINFQRSFFGDLRRAEGVILQIHLLLFLLVCLGIFKEENDWLKLFKITLLVSGVSSILAVLQKLSLWQPFGYDFSGRPVGTFSNPDFFGPYLVLAIFLGLFILMQEKRQKFKIFWLLVLILDVFALILTQMRVAWIGLGAGFIFIFCWLAFNYKNYKTQIKKIIVIPIVIFVIFLIFTISNNDFLNKLGKIFSWPTRLVAWDIAWNSFLQRPILGWGPESFLFVYNKIFLSYTLLLHCIGHCILLNYFCIYALFCLYYALCCTYRIVCICFQ